MIASFLAFSREILIGSDRVLNPAENSVSEHLIVRNKVLGFLELFGKKI
jgi:hypothetical protein